MPMVMILLQKLFDATQSIWSELKKIKNCKNEDDADTKTIRSDIGIHLKWAESARGKNCDWFTWQSVVSRPLLFSPFCFQPFCRPPSFLPRFHFLHQVCVSSCRFRSSLKKLGIMKFFRNLASSPSNPIILGHNTFSPQPQDRSHNLSCFKTFMI